jgi:hypothetical protein
LLENFSSDPNYDPLQNYKLFFRYNDEDEKPARVASDRGAPGSQDTRVMQGFAEAKTESREIGIKINLEKVKIDADPPSEIPVNNWISHVPFKVQIVGILGSGVTLVRLEDQRIKVLFGYLKIQIGKT